MKDLFGVFRTQCTETNFDWEMVIDTEDRIQYSNDVYADFGVVRRDARRVDVSVPIRAGDDPYATQYTVCFDDMDAAEAFMTMHYTSFTYDQSVESVE
jgi:hypothetical protein